jgi:hypothetical protein
MSGVSFTCEGIEFSLIQEMRGWTANLPRFGRTMYFASQEEAIDEAVRLINAFLLPRVIRQLDHAA